ncbi:MAG TPA: carboxy-S-adenosyl-L-methionine synthase CmoA [Gammaproteobacteria bacterium]|nr:carboxy-S-adenosyl-L-methionine synthase CmoA [Gammaproteobacteria bacterium]
MKDKLFSTPKPANDFRFGAETASVFDDMVSRSVPYYDEIQRMVCEIAESFAVPGTNIYDIGCATATTLIALSEQLDSNDIQLIGMDNSDEMLSRAASKISKLPNKNRIKLVNANLNNQPPVENSSVVILLLTLQFVRPLNRDKLIRKIYNGLNPNGCLILVEKVTGSSTLLNRLYIEYYYKYKRKMGYSDMEISQKREALENILIPYHNEENRKMLIDTGFSQIEEFFRWYNFSGLVAIK